MTLQNPYTSPEHPLSSLPATPGVVTWFRVYAGVMTFVYMLLFVAAVLMLVFAPSLADDADNPEEVLLIQGIVFAVMSLPLGGAFIIGAFMPVKPWAWIYGIVLIGLGMTSCCCLPATIPLLIFWIKPETQTYFGRSKGNPTTGQRLP
jgi:MFS family permease